MSLAEMGGGFTSEITQPTVDIANAVRQTGGVLGGGGKTKQQTQGEKIGKNNLLKKTNCSSSLSDSFS